MSGHMPSDELQRYLFAGSQHQVQIPVVAWLVEVPRCRVFVVAHRDKIRKTVRMQGDEEARRDLLVELGVGYRFLHEKRFTLAYELFAAQKTRGPDYVVTYTTKFAFTVEVTRLRTACDGARWAEVICAKLRQLPPAQANVLVVATSMGQCVDVDLAQPVRMLRTLAERKEDSFFAQRGWRDARDFLRQLPRLSTVVWWDAWDAPTGGAWMLWHNPQAKHPLPHEARNALSH